MNSNNKHTRIIFTGGGTMGSVSPLIAIAEYFKTISQDTQDTSMRFLWVGTYRGPEWKAVAASGIRGVRIHTGKLRRYLSLWNFTDSFFLLLGFLQSLYHIMRFRPTVIVNAGSYVGVPVLWAGWLAGIPSVLLQLDIRPSLSNIVTAFAARSIAASCAGAAQHLPRKKAVITGIPIRSAIRQSRDICQLKQKRDMIRSFLGISDARPYVLVVGGGTGAQYLNELARSLDMIENHPYHVVLVSGSRSGNSQGEQSGSLHEFSFLQDEYAGALACADAIVSRAGMGTISELAYLKKAAIIVPIPDSHQQDNAAYFEQEGCIIHCEQVHANAQKVNSLILDCIRDEGLRTKLGNALSKQFFPDAAERVANLIRII